MFDCRWKRKIGTRPGFRVGMALGLAGYADQALDLVVIGFEFAVTDRPVDDVGAGDQSEGAEQLEVDRLEAVKITAHEVARSTDAVAVPETPTRIGRCHGAPAFAVGFLDHVLFVTQSRGVDRAPATGEFVLGEVLFFEPGAFFQHDDAVAGLCQTMSDRAATGAAADDTNIEIGGHNGSSG